METHEASTLSTPSVATKPYEPTDADQKLLRWVIANKMFKFNPKATKVVQDYIYRKEGASLDALSSNEINTLKIQALSLGITLTR